jgi:TolB-like protein
MGEVYRAYDPRLGREVALKVLKPDVAADGVRLERFLREARAVAALNHPHIVTIYSTEEDHGTRFLTMELVEGESLDALIPKGGFAPGPFLDLALPLADALTAAHQKQITHRDLKPGNVMVSADGKVKVLDFGLAKIGPAEVADQSVDATRAHLTRDGTIVGTMPYMSPEQVEGRPLDARSDLFSLGVMFHEMLSGRRPFQGASSAALMSSILRDTPTSVGDARRDLPESLSRLVGRCLEKRPDDRVQTARDIYNELRHVQRQLESGSTPAVTATPAAGTAIAILPFSARGGDRATSLAEGLIEEVSIGLSRFSYLRVVSRTLVAGTIDTSDPKAASAATGARFLIDGRVSETAGILRVAVRLVDTIDGSHLWAERYDRDGAAGLLAVQDEVAGKVVATVADESGVLIRTMAKGVRERPIDELSLSELILRFHLYVDQFSSDEHARLRAAFERVLERESSAGGWGCLSVLYSHEWLIGFNPLPDLRSRQRRAATRAIDIDPHEQRALGAVALCALFERDLVGLETAVERIVAINPYSRLVGSAALWLALAGQFDRAAQLMAGVAALNPKHPAWYNLIPFFAAYRRSDFEQALVCAKRTGIAANAWGILAAVTAAGRLGRRAEAREALEALRRNHPRLLDVAAARQEWARTIWDDGFVSQLMDGFEQALAL